MFHKMEINFLYILGLVLSGGLGKTLWDKFFASKKDGNDFSIAMMNEMRKYVTDAFARIGSLEHQIDEWKIGYDKLQDEYNDLNRKYIALKKDFELLKSKSV